ncbi:MAG: hypothetical protein JOZ94_05515 [Xanthobacteraceae bacterium]|nr:hypothetical protein [Xanthobacteraceae bacterium]MBV9627693.1 hypothetical protein [Xanthobacteraceae bacterium]
MSKDRPALPAATYSSGAVVIDAAETGTAVIELPELPQRLAPSIAILQGGERIHAEAVEIEETAIPIPEGAPRWAHDSAAFSAEDVSSAAWGVRPGAGGGRGRKGSVAGSPRTGRRLRAALLSGALLATFALGWFGGATSTRLMSPPPSAPSVLKQRLDASTRSAARARSDAAAGAAVRKLSSAPVAARPEPVALENGAKDLPRPLPTPETRPTTIEGWTVRDVSGGFASLEGPQGTWRAARGDIVPGLGRVDSIVRWGNYWLVSTSRGLIASE